MTQAPPCHRQQGRDDVTSPNDSRASIRPRTADKLERGWPYETIPAHAGIRVGATYNLTVAAPELAVFAGAVTVRHDANGH